MEPVFRCADRSRPSGEISEAEGFIVDHLEKAGRAAAMQDTGLGFCVRGGLKMLVCASIKLARSGLMPETSFFHAP